MEKDAERGIKHYVGILLLLLGGYFLIKDLGLITANLPIWPLIMVGTGLYFLFPKNK